MYLVGELDNTVRVFLLGGLRNDGPEGRGERFQEPLRVMSIQVASTLGPGSNRSLPDGVNLAAEVAISNDGRFAYASNRNTISYSSDTIAVFSVTTSDEGHLSFLGLSKTYGKTPRHFSLSNDPGNKYVAVGNEVSNSLMLFARDSVTGFLSSVVGNLTLGGFDLTQTLGPTAVIWL
jgi:6-phosphogluconolactonase (cycloisomerase 2 family)